MGIPRPFGILKPSDDVIWGALTWLLNATCQTQRKKPDDNNNNRDMLQLQVQQLFSVNPAHFVATSSHIELYDEPAHTSPCEEPSCKRGLQTCLSSHLVFLTCDNQFWPKIIKSYPARYPGGKCPKNGKCSKIYVSKYVVENVWTASVTHPPQWLLTSVVWAQMAQISML